MNKRSRLLAEGLVMYRGVSEKIDKFLEKENAVHHSTADAVRRRASSASARSTGFNPSA
jgi:hypothetical protein